MVIMYEPFNGGKQLCFVQTHCDRFCIFLQTFVASIVITFCIFFTNIHRCCFANFCIFVSVLVEIFRVNFSHFGTSAQTSPLQEPAYTLLTQCAGFHFVKRIRVCHPFLLVTYQNLLLQFSSVLFEYPFAQICTILESKIL